MRMQNLLSFVMRFLSKELADMKDGHILLKEAFSIQEKLISGHKIEWYSGWLRKCKFSEI